MNRWLNELRQALDVASQGVDFFFRDDDAGWSDERLLELLDLFERHSMPIDVAAIPLALTSGMAAELRLRLEAQPGALAIHQHGFAHQNHEPPARRKCEFGLTRDAACQQSDIEWGKRRLNDLFGPLVSPIFTPPWNRCTSATGECLRHTGFRILSRDATALPLNLAGLIELPITIDWFARARGARLSLEELGAALAASVRAAAPVGVMFHHALMDETERRQASELLALLASHTNARSSLMEQFIKRLSQDNVAEVANQSAGWRPEVMPFAASAERK
jgi:hypothetical protein